MSLFLAGAREKPGTLAVVVGGSALTYRELATASGTLAARLHDAGVRPGQTVLLRLRQSAHTVVGMIAALRLGAAWCVVEPRHPEDRPAAPPRDVDCAAVVVEGGAGEGHGGLLPVLGIDARTGDGTPVADTAPTPHLPAYVVTTSGSSGAPKAIVVSRGNLAHMVAARQAEEGLVTFSTCRFTWDGALLLLFQALCTGGTAVLPDHRALPDPSACAALVLQRGVRQLVSPPSYYRLMLPHLTGAGLDEVILAGEAFPEALIERHRAVLPRTRLRNEYGPTEATVTVLGHDVSGTYDGHIPIGTPLGEVAVHVLDGRLRPTPPGELGELYVGGAQVAQGYAGRPGETAHRFVADPFHKEPGARLYRTGDLVRVDREGRVVFHGRADGQLKVRGTRVERHAVEAVLETHPAVRQATVLGVPGPHGDTRLVAFWSPAPTAVALPDARELTGLCTAHLHDQAVPETFVTVGRMPLAASGKTDEAALTALLPDAPAGWTPLQSAVARLWRRVLRHDDFGPGDSFFTVGGNSRRVVELHLGLQREWPGALRVGQLFDLDTVAAQAQALAAAEEAAEQPAGDAAELGDR
ncbi:peptide synthetase [Streptomyces sp. V2]|nr:peptide synthetase [Streptomyces sp. V2]